MASLRAERILRDFARQTNLLLAGRPLHAFGDPALAQEVRTLGSALGMRPLPPTASEEDRPTLGVAETLLLVEIDVDGPEFWVGTEAVPTREDADARIAFAQVHMPCTRSAARALELSLKDLHIGIALPLEPKTAVLAIALRDAGASVSVYAHPDEVDAEVAESLRERGLEVVADANATGAEERANAVRFLSSGLNLLIDDGAHLIRLAHETVSDAVAEWVGATEETTSGVTAVRAMDAAGVLRIPVIAVNDAATKTTFDNRYGTGQSCVFAIADALDEEGLRVSDLPALVIGYGPVGAGVAAYLRALGATVTVAETDPIRALVAWHDGFAVAAAEDAAEGALVVSATGVRDTVTAEIASRARFVAVAGGVPGEVAADAMAAATNTSESTAPVSAVLGGGGAINLVAAEGNPIEIMDLSFATQLVAVDHLVRSAPTPGVHDVPSEAVDAVARSAAVARGITVGERAGIVASDDWRSPRYTTPQSGGTS